MKKYTLLLLLSIFAASAGHAQLIRFGVKGGGNFADQSISYNGNDLNPSGYTSFHAGILSEVRIPIIGLGVQAEVLYSQKGSNYTVSGFDIKNRFDYIDIPIYVRWTLGIIPIIKPYIGIGPYFSFPVNIEVNGADNSTEWVSEDFDRSDFGFGATLGAEIFNKLQVSLCYQLGTKNLYNGPYDITTKNRNFALSVGFLIF